MDQETKNYELAYLLIPSISEADVLASTGNLNSLMEDSGGIIRHVETPRMRLLAYAVKKNGQAYFGWTTFNMARANLALFEKKLKGWGGLLRYLIVEEEIYAQPMPLFAQARPAPARSRKPAIPKPPVKEEAGKLDLEELDKKLEEILGK